MRMRRLNELSCQYREIKKYGIERGMIINENNNLSSVIGYEWKREQTAAIEMNSFYVSAMNSDIVLKIVKSVGQDEKGKNYQAYSIAVMDSRGNIIEQIDNYKDNRHFYDSVKKLQNKYSLTDCKRFEKYQLAKEYSKRTVKNVQDVEEEQYPDLNVNVSFSQAVNHVYDDRPLCVIADSKSPSYIALSSVQNEQLKIEIVNRFGQHQEEIFIPLVKDKNSNGYLNIVKLQQKYGFSDQVCEFENIESAKEYIMDTQRTKHKAQEKGL